MKASSAAASILILSAATVWAQSTSSGTASAGMAPASGRRPVASRMVMASSPENRMTSVQTATALKRMQEMENTLNQMHALLKEMHTKATSRSSKDQLAKANLDMWELMLAHLDKQFEELRAATLARQDLDARRANLYKQAMDKADAAAQRARGSGASQATAPVSAGQGASAGSADQPAADAKAGQAPPTPSAPASGAPK
jgi:peptidoglycan hydrolase CwlO-like protein